VDIIINNSQSVLIILTFYVAFFGRQILGSLIGIELSNDIQKIIYGYSWWLIPIIITIGYLFGFKNVVKEFRLHKGFVIGFLWSHLWVLYGLLGYL